MGKGSFIAMVALLVAMVGAIVAFAAYFKRRNYSLCDDLDDMLDDDGDLDYYATPVAHDEEDNDLPDDHGLQADTDSDEQAAE